MKIKTPLRQCSGRNLLQWSVMGVAAMVFLGISQAGAADGTWNVDAPGDWETAGNWTPGIPGATSGTTNSDIATFGLTLTATRAVSVDTYRNIGGITFSNASSFGYSLNSGALHLSSGGVIQSLAANGAHNVFINSTVVIEGESATASFTNNATSASNRLLFGNISGVSTGTNFTILTLDGSNVGANTIGGSTASITGRIAIVKNGAGTWRLNGAGNTYNGGVTVNAGQLGFTSNAAAFGTGTLTINGGKLRSANAIASATFTNQIVVGGNFTVQDASGISNAFDKNFSGAMDLGGATRTITATTMAVAGHPGSNFIFSGVISNGGLTKAGDDVLTLSGVNTYTGDTTVSLGTLLLADNSQTSFAIGASGVNNQILGTGTISLNGDFSFDLISAGVGVGDSWNIVNVGTLTETFGATFSVLGFSDIGGGVWEGLNGGTTYQFNEGTGLLAVVPEPSVLALLAFGLPALMSFRRRRS